MKVTFDTLNENEVSEVVTLLENMGMIKVGRLGKPMKQTETPLGAPKTKKATPSIPKEEKASDEPKKTPAKKTGTKVSLGDLKELAKLKVNVSGREKVKAIIAEFADKLAEVKESDYVELAAKLEI